MAFGALNAFGGGCYGLLGAKGVPPEWLAGSPFKDYTVPSLILFLVVGGSSLAASIAVFRRSPWARPAAGLAGCALFLWITVQVAVIGFVSWLQPAVFAASLLVLLSARFLPGKH